MKTRIHFVCQVCFLLLTSFVFGQIDPSLYGDEWISYDQNYYKFSISENGIYRISKSDLEQAGIPFGSIEGDDFKIYSLGREIPLRTSTPGTFSENDFIEFFGAVNNGSVDALLFDDPVNQQLNPFISLYGEARPYFLTWETDGKPLRYEHVENGIGANGLPPKEPYYIHREIVTYDEFHHKPSHDGRNFIRYSSMDYGEGYGSELARDRTISLDVDRLSSFGVDPRVILKFGTNVLSRNWQISTDKRILKTSPQRGYGIIDIDERFPLEELSEGRFNIHISPLSDENEKHTVSRIELHYPRRYEFDGETEISFQQQASIISRYIELHGFGGSQPVLYNLTEKTYVVPEQEGDILKFVTPAASHENSWILVDLEDGIKSVSSISIVDFKPRQHIGNYLIISHESLISSGAVQAYADYRSSVAGGGYVTSVVNIADLTDMYAYGVKGHPIAIKKFMQSLKDEDTLPDYVFIIGKGREYTEIKEGKKTNALVPTFGIPGSDNLFLAFDGKRHPQRAIGRLAAQTSEDVTNYLDKIKTHEIRNEEEQTKEEQSWKKGVIHLSGGSSTNQSILFRFLNDMGDVISNNTFGADVKTFRKTSADPLERVTSEEIMNQIDQGAALLTFFGHSAVGTFDFSLEDPDKYNNKGRNPIILSLGCHSGNVHTAAGGISEDFVLEKDNGAIAFIASSGTAYPEPQYFTGINFYDLFGGEMYGQSIGNILQRSLENRTDNSSVSVQTLIEQLTLHGDPAFRYGSFEGPDYSIDQESISVTPGILNATTPNFTLEFEVLNLGAMHNEVLEIQVVHLLPGGQPADTLLIVIPAPAFSTEVTVEMNHPGVSWIGANRILITIDPASEIQEFPVEKAEKNNELIDHDGKKGVTFFVFDNSAKPVFPPNFGIANAAPFSLKSAVNNGLHPGGKFIMQVDTTETFDSPLLTEETRDNYSSIIDWTPDIVALENVVYYWRIAPINEEENKKSNNWQSSSFIYLPGSSTGWNQSHYYQWQKDTYYKMAIDQGTRSFEFIDRVWDIRIKNEIRDEGDFWVYVNNTPWASLNPRGKGSLISIFAWDRQNTLFKNNGSDFGSIPFTSDGFLYDMKAERDIENILSLLEAIPNGARVFFHTMLDNDTSSLNVPSWNRTTEYGVSLMDQLELFGAERVRELSEKGTVPYTFIFDKGEGPVIEDIANNIYETVDLTSRARTIWSEGTITSVPLQAQDRWLRLMWAEHKQEYDETRLLVLGIKPGGNRDTLKRIQDDYDINLTSIDPVRYPQIELVYQSVDNTNKTSAQLSHWRVITNSLPDAAFYAKTSSFEIKDTINAGEALHLDYDLINLTNEGMEPVLIKYTLIDKNYKEKTIIRRSLALPGLDTINVVESIPTDQLAGDYQLVIEINPNQDQKEVTDCNNLGYTSFHVRPDRRNPFLDVTFDGKHIVNKERISSDPEIVVSLRDEDAFVLLDDPEDFDITIYYPQFFEWRVDATSENVEWKPSGSLEDNQASFVIRPNFTQEGLYTLEAQAKDIAGNSAGERTLRITFEVNFEQDFPRLTVSPNPMTSSTEFSYYLDSDFLPDIFDLYIYSADGKRVGHATKADFGGLRKGLNTYRWDGLSDYGNQLPTGLYFYEIVNSFDSRKEKRKGSVMVLRN